MTIHTKTRHFGTAALAAGAAFTLAACSTGGSGTSGEPAAAAEASQAEPVQPNGDVSADLYTYDEVREALPTGEELVWTEISGPGDVSSDGPLPTNPQNACDEAMLAQATFLADAGGPSGQFMTYQPACDGQTYAAAQYAVQPPLAQDWPTVVISDDTGASSILGTTAVGNVVISATGPSADGGTNPTHAISVMLENLQ